MLSQGIMYGETPVTTRIEHMGFELSLAVNKTTFVLGETVPIEVKLTNVDNESKTILFTGGGGKEAPAPWIQPIILDVYSELAYFFDYWVAWVPVEVVLEPEEGITWVHHWKPRHSNGNMVLARRYDVVGTLMYVGTPAALRGLETPSISILIFDVSPPD